MNQRNVIASFADYDEANAASQELMRAGLGDVQLRIVPPPSMRRSGSERVIVSAIVTGERARLAESILSRHGSVDLVEDAHWRGASMRRGSSMNRDRRHERDDWSNLPWGAIAGAAVAIVTGFAFMRGARMFGDDTQDRRSLDWRGAQSSRHDDWRSVSATSSYPDGSDMRRALGSDRSGRHSSHQGNLHEAGRMGGLGHERSHEHELASGSPVRSPSSGQGLGSGTGSGSAAGSSGHLAGTDIGAGTGVSGAQSGRGMSAGGSSPGSNLGAGSLEGRGTHVGSPASHGHDTSIGT